MERISTIACAGLEGLKKASQWTKDEVAAQRQRLGGSDSELRPRKRARRNGVVKDARPATWAQSPRDVPQPTTSLNRRDGDVVSIMPTATIIERQDELVTDTVRAPSIQPTSENFIFTGVTVADSQRAGVPTGVPTSASANVVVVTATPSPSAAPSTGMSVTTEAIIISCSIAGTLVIITLICLLSICYRKKKRRQLDEVALKGMPRRMQSSSTMRSDGWQSESSEPEKQSLINAARSRSVSPASRGVSPSAPMHGQQRSLGGYKAMATIPESPQPPSPTSIYTKKSPPQLTGPQELQLEYTNMQYEESLHSPLKPPPLRIRQGGEGGSGGPVNSALLPSPKNMFSAVRLPFMSGASNGNRRSSAGQSLASSFDEERGMAPNRRTMESETLPATTGAGPRYRDSFWSVAASSIMKTKGFNSTYGDSVYGAGSDLRHTRTNSYSSGTHSRTASSGLGMGVEDPGVATIHGRTRSHSSVYSSRLPSQALIPALPPMPSRYELDQKQQGHKSGLQNQSVTSIGSQASGPPGDVELKGRLHSVDFWAREERDMRLGTFAPAELEGCSSGHPTPILEVPTPLETSTPRDSKGAAIGAAMGGTPRSSNPYFAGAVAGMQGGYSVAIQGGNGPVRESTLMPHGYSHESADDGRRLWNRGRSAERGEGRQSSSTFQQHPGEFVMI